MYWEQEKKKSELIQKVVRTDRNEKRKLLQPPVFLNDREGNRVI